ncbi:DedA family protein [Variovorax soli]|uniref:Membrane protein DedA with SNARE-associated domain n=1 Tax=Variovorax soli TaxID=376815 RepID=A0ABU1NMP6_9BURK|nr:DedA family protein [Variovorax soli]MDR6539735.1 membrane protein DedA with SNARE-associated domain [Variovorax soli]
MSITQFLSEYGYLAVLAGCLMEGESVLLLAGLAAQEGYLSFVYVVVVAFCGATLGDQAFYFLGRYVGGRLIANRPRLQVRANVVTALLQRYDAPLIIGVRFMYGFRILGPIAIGASTVSPWRFLTFNALGAALWAPLIAGAGYTFGYALESVFVDMGVVEKIGLVAVLFVAVTIGLHLRRRRRDGSEARPEKPPS